MHYYFRTTLILSAASVAMGLLAVAPSSVAEAAPTLIKEATVYGTETPEVTPILFQGQSLLFQSHRPWSPSAVPNDSYLTITNLTTGVLAAAPFGYGHSLGSAYVSDGQINVFASELSANNWFQDIYRFTSSDMVNWTKTPAVARTGNEHLLNSSVCQDDQGYLMAYESDNPVKFCFKFARSSDLATWTKLDVPVFAGPNGNEYSACPTIRYSGGHYYAMYLAIGGDQYAGQYVTQIARSEDLTAWEYSDKNPVLAAAFGEGINNSDVDLIEIDGKTYVYYFTGDQRTWGESRRAVYDGPMSQFLGSYFPTPAPEPGTWMMLGTGLVGLLTYIWRKRTAIRG